MFPTFNDGDEVTFDFLNNANEIEVNDIIVFNHPFKNETKVVKRVKTIVDKINFFVEGDNPDITCSDDSHNFGHITCNNVIAIKKEKE